MTGAQALSRRCSPRASACVFGIPGAQENELWDTFKEKHVPYLLVTHEFSAACMADGYARSTGRPGVLCVVPGPGVTNSLTGLGEALLDSVAGGVPSSATWPTATSTSPFQVHCLDQVDLLKPVTKCVFPVQHVGEIPGAVRQAFAAGDGGRAGAGRRGRAVQPAHRDRTTSTARRRSARRRCRSTRPPSTAPLALLARPAAPRRHLRRRWAAWTTATQLAAVAEVLQAPVATSVSGKGVIHETPPAGRRLGLRRTPRGGRDGFADDRCTRSRPASTLLAIGVKFSEVSTGFYANPQPQHVDPRRRQRRQPRQGAADRRVRPRRRRRVPRPGCSACADRVAPARPTRHLVARDPAAARREAGRGTAQRPAGKCGVDPLALRRWRCAATLPEDALLFTDVTRDRALGGRGVHGVCQPRTYFNPVDNQAMGWSIPAAIGAQRVCPGRHGGHAHRRRLLPDDGDGDLDGRPRGAAGEVLRPRRPGLPLHADAAEAGLPADDGDASWPGSTTRRWPRRSAWLPGDRRRTTELDAGIRGAVCHPGPVLVRVVTDYGKRKIRWLDAVRDRYVKELSAAQKARFLARVGTRAVSFQPRRND